MVTFALSEISCFDRFSHLLKDAPELIALLSLHYFNIFFNKLCVAFILFFSPFTRWLILLDPRVNDFSYPKRSICSFLFT